ncbi:MAG: phage neck terminator protein [Lachnospiraceae bacterium]
MKFKDIRNGVIVAATAYMELPIILSDQVDAEMECPFILYSVVTPYVSANTTGHFRVERQGDTAVKIRREDPTCVISFTACSKNRMQDGMQIFGEDEALDLAEKLQGWFLCAGLRALQGYTAVVESVSNVQSRSFLQVDEAARRWGFDVTIRYIRMDEREVGTVKEVKLREVKK